MKKGLAILTIVAFAAFFTACKKDYTCECTTKDGTGAVLASSSATGKMTKSDAESWCSAGESSSTIFGTTWITTCTLN